ncbi:MAG TPA: hypothetical protein VFA12_20670 [Stellaceae bacterium]|nr:hypothetical protein [Stellaceae bacterium]
MAHEPTDPDIVAKVARAILDRIARKTGQQPPDGAEFSETACEAARAAIAAYEASLKERGLVIVPREPTDGMTSSAIHLLLPPEDIPDADAAVAEIWREMISSYTETEAGGG